jgi:hypothetical protein
MSPWLWRAMLLGLLLAIVGVRSLPSDDSNIDLSSRTIAYLEARGWQQIQTPPAKPLKVLAFRAPDCDSQIDVVPIDTNFEGRGWFDRIGKPGDRRQFIYLDRRWNSPNAWTVAATRVVYNELGLLRLSRFAATAEMLMIVEPSACHLVDAVDWQTLWVRRSSV